MPCFSRLALISALALPLTLPVSAHAQSSSGVAVGAATVQAPGVRAAGGEIAVRAKVVEVDQARRLATLRSPQGKLVTVDVPAAVRNFDQVRVGDELVVRYMAAVAAAIQPASKSGIRERVERTAAASAPEGGLPGSAVGRVVEVLAVIQSIDRQARTVSLRGAKRMFTVDAPASVDIAKLKVGDEVRAVFTEAAVISVEPAPAAR